MDISSLGGDIKHSISCLLNVMQIKVLYFLTENRFDKNVRLKVACILVSVYGLGSRNRLTLNKIIETMCFLYVFTDLDRGYERDNTLLFILYYVSVVVDGNVVGNGCCVVVCMSVCFG